MHSATLLESYFLRVYHDFEISNSGFLEFFSSMYGAELGFFQQIQGPVTTKCTLVA